MGIFLSLLFLPLTVKGSIKDINVYPIEKKIEVPAGGSGIIILKVDIPDRVYIYGNPKGPGIGRPTTIEVTHPDNFIFKDESNHIIIKI